MSGSFNQDKNQGWNVFQPRTHGAKFEMYDNQLMVIVSESQKTERASGSVYFTKEAIKLLKHPEWITVMVRGSSIGFAKSDDGKGSYKVARTESNGNAGRPFLNLTALVKSMAIKPGAYEAHMEGGGVLVFDTASKPSKI